MNGQYYTRPNFIEQVLGETDNVQHFAATNLLMQPDRSLFVCDTYVNETPAG
jgi:malate dehydrogenase (oxaloacetate-decarboxylating)(NADP+)